MAISFNGSSNPSAVKYNGSFMASVNASVGGSAMTQVWPQGEGDWPETISLVRMYNSIVSRNNGYEEGSFDVYLRDLEFVSELYDIDASTGVVTRTLVYDSPSSSFDLKWRRYVYAGALRPPSTPNSSLQPKGSTPTITGIPSSIDYDRFTVEPDTTYALGFKVGYGGYSDYDSRIASLPTAQVTCHVVGPTSEGAYSIAADSTTYTASEPLGLYTATEGFVFQKPARVRFIKRMN